MSDKYDEVADRIARAHGYSVPDNRSSIAAILRESFPAPSEPAKNVMALLCELLGLNPKGYQFCSAVERITAKTPAEAAALIQSSFEAWGKVRPSVKADPYLETTDGAIADLFETLERGMGCDELRLSPGLCEIYAKALKTSRQSASEPSDEEWREAMEEIDQWSRAYPHHIFGEPTPEQVDKVCKALGCRIDNIAAMILRNFTKHFGEVARRALASRPAPTDEKALRDSLAGWEQFREAFQNLSYHRAGMGCGIEDRGITDRYVACEYGWDEAMDRVAENIPEPVAISHESPKEQA